MIAAALELFQVIGALAVAFAAFGVIGWIFAKSVEKIGGEDE